MAGMRKLLGRGFADRTNEGHGLRLAALHINAAIHFEEEEPGGARSFISTYCGVAIDPNMSMCGGVRSRASYGYAEKK